MSELDRVYRWQDDARCRGMEVDFFFPGRGEPTDHIREFCAGCPVRVPCLEDAVWDRHRFGWVGGVGEVGRRRIRKERRARGAA